MDSNDSPRAAPTTHADLAGGPAADPAPAGDADVTQRDLPAAGTAPIPELEVVVPLRDEGANIEPLCDALAAWIRDEPRHIEVIAVDDGSEDGTLAALRREAARRGWLRVVALGRPLGKSAALAAGFAASRAPVLATMDGDLQDDPREIDCLLEVLDPRSAGRGLARSPDGADLVVGWRRVRRDGALRRLEGWLWSRLLRLLTPLDLHDANCGLKVMWRPLALSLPLDGDRHRLLPALAALRGYRVRERAVLHHPRRFGQSKVRFGRGLAAVLDLSATLLLERSAERPARAFGGLAAWSVGGGAALAVAAGGLAALASPPAGLAVAAIAAGCMGGGIAVLGVGLAAELVLGRLGAVASAAGGLGGPGGFGGPGGPGGPGWAGGRGGPGGASAGGAGAGAGAAPGAGDPGGGAAAIVQHVAPLGHGGDLGAARGRPLGGAPADA